MVNELWQYMLGYFDYSFLGVAVGQWLLFLLLTAAFYAVLGIAIRIARPRLALLAARTISTVDDIVLRLLGEARWYGMLGAAVFLAGFTANLGQFDALLRSVSLALIFVQIGMWGNAFIDSLLANGFRVARMSEESARTASGVVRWFGTVLLWICIVLLILSAFHIEITPLLAGLGVGGIAIAFALQHILGDVFCSVAIVLDRPFEVGDFIISGDYLGTVEHIGIKTTRLRSLGGEQIIIPNSDLIGSRIRNYKRMEQRRIVFRFGVLYSTPIAKLAQIPDIVADIMGGIKQVRFDRAHFKEFGDSALQFEVVYIVLTADFNKYMDIQQQINLELMRRLSELGVTMPFPTRTINLDEATATLLAKLGNEPGAPSAGETRNT